VIRSVYQPIVRLADRQGIGYEALVRGPVGSRLERPDDLFGAARRHDLETALDWECWRAALHGALGGGLGPDQALFANVEPSSAASWVPEIGDPLLEDALGRFPLIVELTERALPNHTTDLIPLAEDLRRRGARIALDDVGTDPRSLALMPFLRPDVIKLDHKLMQNSPSREIAEVVHAVNAEAEWTGALILAEGIETEDHLRRALALGASYGQGRLFGRPGGLRSEPTTAPAIFPSRRRAATVLPSVRTPFEIVTAKRAARRADKRLLLELSLSMERQTAIQGSAAVVISTFQEARYFTAKTAPATPDWPKTRLWSRPSGSIWTASPPLAFAASTSTPTSRCGASGTSPSSAPHFGAAFVARDLGDDDADAERRFDFAMTTTASWSPRSPAP
jgi:EAL domain-containing protein (putative c-di-GMP-specific phosphodiesterase class I)